MSFVLSVFNLLTVLMIIFPFALINVCSSISQLSIYGVNNVVH